MRVDLKLAVAIAKVDAGTIRKWVHRGHVNRYPDGYDTNELLLWLDQRDTGKAIGGYAAAHANQQRNRGERIAS